MADALPTRQETDSMGEIAVPSDRYWGAQTQRSIRYFSIGQDKMPLEVVRAIAIAKKASALANADLGKLPQEKADLIVRAADEIIAGQLDDHFPLHVWMTGSGTQCNMNVNEVIANRAIELAGGVMGSKTPIHPNDHVNMSQSSNDIFPTAMHIAAAQALTQRLNPAVTQLRDALEEKAQAWSDIVKIGRTHLQDAVPLTLGQEFSGYVGMLDDNLARLESALPGLYQLAIGGTALGTGLNAGPGFAEAAAQHIAQLTGLPFINAPNKFTVMGAHDAVVMASGVLKTLAVSLYKIANDIRLLSCGPRAGFAELHLPENEPGSSIMPGKVNPTQCEALAMVTVQVMGYDAAVAFAGASGYLDMNVYKPMMIFNLLQSAGLMADSCHNFTEFLVAGMTPNYKQIDQYVQQSLMLVTALSPAIGYDRASQIAHHAFEHDLTLKQAALDLGYVSEAEFDALIDPRRMTHP
ncbi:class II fumarate hydratase [Nodosilinea sp. LEGE 06152]|uniref:class II fumarate hydratase n=1 Tax=Nodosilinea sp. LEGE 06152 TaxID=2777966 RepID=UPI00187E40FD|nr:class II fumarate hydratase [Nodosilinea sp. LEGE 06152]MBE9159440.1 class II fumarate hydratase [Nodosilinea sp. LEGE 06152]